MTQVAIFGEIFNNGIGLPSYQQKLLTPGDKDKDKNCRKNPHNNDYFMPSGSKKAGSDIFFDKLWKRYGLIKKESHFWGDDTFFVATSIRYIR